MVREQYIPERGDVVWLDFNPQTGREQRGRRPAFVLSPKSYNRIVGLAVFCPITNQSKDYPFEVKIPDDSNATGVILSDHVKSLDWRIRQADYICSLPDEVTEEVLGKITALLN